MINYSAIFDCYMAIQAADNFVRRLFCWVIETEKITFTTQTTNHQGRILNHCNEKVLMLSMFLTDCVYRKLFAQKWAKIGYLFLKKFGSFFAFQAF